MDLARALVSISAEAAYNAVGTALGTASKVANDTRDTAKLIVHGDITSIPDKLLHDGLETGAKIATDSLETVAHAASRALSSRSANILLEFVADIFNKAGDDQVVDTILQFMQRYLEAVGRSLSGAVVICNGIFTNGTSEDLLRYILDHLYDLVQFIYDVCRPGTVISENGGNVLFPGSNNPYNELNLRVADNRYAVINQVRRVVKTLVEILKLGRTAESLSPGRELDDIQMDVSLANDFDKDGNPMPPTYLSRLEKNQQFQPGETWLFVNGVANEYVWFQRSCDKIRDAFKREVKGVYNRTDGILWDLIECFGEHSPVGRNELIERTQSSQAAQKALEEELRKALLDNSSSAKKVVMIAHSQGCLILRLALQTLVTDTMRKEPQLRENMKQRLRVFTFASPAIDWQVLDDSRKQPLSDYANLTEHYAHEVDFVSVLGIVNHREGYGKDPVFLSNGGRGHLLGAHYTLRAEDYQNGDESKLFKALSGGEIA